MNTAAHVERHETPDATIAAAATPGEKLAQARKAQHLTVADVANRLKLSVSQVEALERGQYDRLPGSVFVRGFTRNYARLVRLDPDDTVRAVDDHLPHPAADEASTLTADKQIPMPGKSRRWPLLAGIVAVIFLGAALVDVLWPETTQVATVPAPAAMNAQAPAPTPPEPVAAAPAMVAPGVDAAAAVTADAPAASETTPAAVTATYQPAAGGGRPLKLAFDQKSWVQVKDRDGKVVFEQLNAPGTAHEFIARPPLTLIIGNAQGVRLTYGDRAVDLAPYTRVDVARLTLE